MSLLLNFIKCFNWRKKAAPTAAERQIMNFGTLKTRYNCLVALDLVEFLQHDEYLVMNAPAEGSLHVHGIGTSSILNVDIVRHYLTDESGNDNFWLQEVIQPSTSVEHGAKLEDLFLFSQIDEILPQTSDEWESFFNDFSRTDGQPFTVNDVAYHPVWSSPMDHTELVDPIKAIDEQTGKQVLQASSKGSILLTSRLYSRPYQFIDSGTNGEQVSLMEYLLVSIEDKSVVRCYAGININPAAVNVF